MMISEQTAAFVREHRDEDVRRLALRAHGTGKNGNADDGVDLPVALDQIAGWQTARTKLPQWAACDDIWYPVHLSMEQCSSEATARYKASVVRRLVDGLTAHGTVESPLTASAPTRDAANSHANASSRSIANSPAAKPSTTTLVDLTGGFGVDCSYMAREFDHATYVERQETLCELASHNFAALGLAHVAIVNTDAETHLKDMPPATLIFLDPARRDAHGSRTFAIADCTPDALALAPALLSKAPLAMIKLSPMLDWHKAVADFNGTVREVHIVSAGNECKELLLVLDRGRHETPDLICVNDGDIFAVEGDAGDAHDRAEATHRNANAMHADNAHSHDNDTPTRGTGAPTHGSPGRSPAPSPGDYLCEPNASIMKAGCFAALADRFGVQPVSPNTHLFVTSEPTPPQRFPGRVFRIEAIGGLGKKDLKATLSGLTHANITTRNFPTSVADVRRKLKLKDGGDTTLFATTDAAGRHILIRAVKFVTAVSLHEPEPEAQV